MWTVGVLPTSVFCLVFIFAFSFVIVFTSVFVIVKIVAVFQGMELL